MTAQRLDTYMPGMSLVGLKIASSNLANFVSARYIKHESKSALRKSAPDLLVRSRTIKFHKLMNRRHMPVSNPLSIGLQIGLREGPCGTRRHLHRKTRWPGYPSLESGLVLPFNQGPRWESNPSGRLIPRNLLILRNDKMEKNCKNAEPRYLPGIRNDCKALTEPHET
jgi:hypothetical protein